MQHRHLNAPPCLPLQPAEALLTADRHQMGLFWTVADSGRPAAAGMMTPSLQQLPQLPAGAPWSPWVPSQTMPMTCSWLTSCTQKLGRSGWCPGEYPSCLTWQIAACPAPNMSVSPQSEGHPLHGDSSGWAPLKPTTCSLQRLDRAGFSARAHLGRGTRALLTC